MCSRHKHSMTPMDIQSRRFAKGVNGYRVDEVNDFLREVSSYVSELLRERNELIGKLEVLADKLEEYRGDEESLRAALIGAQKLGDSVVREAKAKAQSIIEDAEHEAQGIVGEARRDIEIETVTLEKKKLEAAKFKTQLLNLYKQHIDFINALPYDEDNLAPAKPAAKPVPKKAPLVPEPVQEEAVHEGIAEIPLNLEEMDTVPTPDNAGFPQQRQSKFGVLRFFGEDEKPTRDE